MLWFHGGGLVRGTVAEDDLMCSQIAASTGITVVSVEYRLAPANPFPAPIVDGLAAWDWLASVRGDGDDGVLVGGESAGAGIAAQVVARLVDRGTTPAGLALVGPMLDDRTAADTSLDSVRHLCWNNTQNRASWTAHLAANPGSGALPETVAIARRADLAGMPPTWIGIGDLDLFLGETLTFVGRLADAGVETELHRVPDAPHGFHALAPEAPQSVRLVWSLHQWICDVIGSGARS